MRSRSISDSLEARKHRYLRLGEQAARVPLALYGSSGVCVGCCLGEDASLAAAVLAQSPFSQPRERWPPRGRRRHTMAVEALVPPDTARGCNSVHECPETAPRGRFRRSVYTPASPRPLARPGRPRVPRRRRPLSPRDARVLGPETHAAGAVTQPPPHTNSQSLRKIDRLTGVLAGAEHLFCVSLVNLACKHKEQGLMKQVDEQWMSAYESERTKTALKDPAGQRVSREHDAHVCAHKVHEAKGE